MRATVRTGDISMFRIGPFKIYGFYSFNEIVSVVLDTNRWYHKTNVLSGTISITIGAEYD